MTCCSVVAVLGQYGQIVIDGWESYMHKWSNRFRLMSVTTMLVLFVALICLLTLGNCSSLSYSTRTNDSNNTQTCTHDGITYTSPFPSSVEECCLWVLDLQTTMSVLLAIAVLAEVGNLLLFMWEHRVFAEILSAGYFVLPIIPAYLALIYCLMHMWSLVGISFFAGKMDDSSNEALTATTYYQVSELRRNRN